MALGRASRMERAPAPADRVAPAVLRPEAALLPAVDPAAVDLAAAAVPEA